MRNPGGMKMARSIHGAGVGERMEGFTRPHGHLVKKMVGSIQPTGFTESTAFTGQKDGKKKNSGLTSADLPLDTKK